MARLYSYHGSNTCRDAATSTVWTGIRTGIRPNINAIHKSEVSGVRNSILCMTNTADMIF